MLFFCQDLSQLPGKKKKQTTNRKKQNILIIFIKCSFSDSFQSAAGKETHVVLMVCTSTSLCKKQIYESGGRLTDGEIIIMNSLA